MVVAAALWWTYFDDATQATEHRLRQIRGRARNVMARDCFSYLHLPMVAGIVLVALGVKKTLGGEDEPLKLVAAAALCGGVALYLAADVGFRRRGLEALDGQRLAAAAACVALVLPATRLPAITTLAMVAAVCAALVVYEARRSARVEPDRPSRGPLHSRAGT